jgi:hypothetical protein
MDYGQWFVRSAQKDGELPHFFSVCDSLTILFTHFHSCFLSQLLDQLRHDVGIAQVFKTSFSRTTSGFALLDCTIMYAAKHSAANWLRMTAHVRLVSIQIETQGLTYLFTYRCRTPLCLHL